MKRIPKFYGFQLKINERYDLAASQKLFRLGIKVNTPNVCNWACPYCYVGDESGLDRPKQFNLEGKVTHEISNDSSWIERMKSWINQGIDLGVRAVTINGTFEPMTSKYIFDVLEFCTNNNLFTTLVTNGSLLGSREIEYLYNLGVSVMTKMNVPLVLSSDINYPKYCSIQKELSGLKLNADKIYESQKNVIESLVSAGFNKKLPDGTTRLGVESVITNINIEFLPDLVSQLRELNIYAHIEVTKLQGFARQNPNLAVTRDKLEWLFKAIQDNDVKNGYEYYDIKPPYLAGTCYENLNRLDILADGKVKPCPGIETVLGDLNFMSMFEVLNSKPLEIIRNLENYIEGDCKSCDLFTSRKCYGGCRGTVYQTLKRNGFNEYDCWVASDPSCWRVTNILDNRTVDALIFDQI
jgi:MoaA/NifB/PqqE/SkfB family radical SAM enzyme